MGFYAAGEIKPRVARILDRREDVRRDRQTADRLSASNSPNDRKVARLIQHILEDPGWNEEAYQVLLVSAYDELETLKLPNPIRNDKPYPWGRNRRYTRSDALASGPRAISELEARSS